MSRSSRRFRVVGLLPTLAVFLMSFGFAVGMLGYALARQFDVGYGLGLSAALRSGAFLVYEGDGGDAVQVKLRLLILSSYAVSILLLMQHTVLTIN